MASVDLFLSYHSADRAPVLELDEALRARGVSTFLDRHQLVAGLLWPEALEKGLAECHAVAVLIGPHGMGAWQKREMYFALDRQVQERSRGDDLPVIPVLLPDTGDPERGFLSLNTWVDLRRGARDPEAIESLLRAARGEGLKTRPELALCPYQGLHFFREEDKAFFHGREKESAELLQLVRSQNLVTLVGSSGSGKSSLAQAGLLPLLRAQRPPHDVWGAAWLSPGDGDTPLRALANALLPLLYPDQLDAVSLQDKSGELVRVFARGPEEVAETLRNYLKSWRLDRFLLIVDPLEELFTQAGEKEARDFLDALLRAQERLPLNLLFTLRADYYDRAIGFDPRLRERMPPGQMNLDALQGESLREAIIEPARTLGRTFPPDLADRILADAGKEPGALPLVELTLKTLWDKPWTHAAYQENGQVAGVIAKSADDAVDALPPDEQPAVRRVFTRLVRIEGDGRRFRQRIPLDALSPTEQKIARELATEKGKRLLVLGGERNAETVTLAHEAILRHWKRLEGWLAEDQELLLWRQRLRGGLEQREVAHGDEGALLHGALLTEAEGWLTKRPADLNPAERSFIEESAALRRRLRTRRIAALAVTSGVILLSLIAVSFAWRNAVHERDRTQARSLGNQATVLFANRHQTALLLAIEALQRTRRIGEPRFPPIEQALRQILTAFGGRVLGSYRGLNLKVIASPDRTCVAALGEDGKIRVWNLNDPDPTKTERIFEGLERADHFEISPQNGWLLAATDDDPPHLLVQKLGGRQLHPEVRSPLLQLAFSPDDHWLALLLRDEGVHLVDLTDPASSGVPVQTGGMVRSLAFSPDSLRLALGGDDGAVRLMPLDGRAEIPTSPASGTAITALCFIPSADALIAADIQGKVREWTWRGETVGWKDLGKTESLGARDLQVSSNGRWLIAWRSGNRFAGVWDLAPGGRPWVRDGVVALSLQGRWLAEANNRGQIVSGNIEEVVLSSQETKIGVTSARTLEISRSGRWLVSGGADRFASLWRATRQPGFPLQRTALGGHDDPIDVLGIGENERWLLTSGSAGEPPRLWNLHMDGPLASAEPQRLHRGYMQGLFVSSIPSILLDSLMVEGNEPVAAAAESVDHRWLAVGLHPSRGDTAEVHLWDRQALTSGPKKLRAHHRGVGALAFSLDGRLLATGGRDGVIHLFHLDQTIVNPVVLEPGGGEITAITFSRDGTWLGVAAEDRILRLWRNTRDLSGPAQPDRLLEGSAEPLTSLAFGASGPWVAAGGGEGTIYLWNRELYPHIPIAVQKHSNSIRTISFSANGRALISVDQSGLALRWRMDENDLERVACQAVGRNLTKKEWDDYLPGEPYHPTCREFPPGS